MKIRTGVVFFLAVSVIFSSLAFGEHKSPDDAWLKLMEGNKRSVSGEFSKRESGAEFCRQLAKGQHPSAIVVACADSRVSPEIVFDQGLGQVFVVRTAGNVVDPIVLGSIEYAVEHLQAPLIVVLGHESCGAVKATLDSKEAPEGNIGAIIKKIMPAVKKAKASGKKGEELLYSSVVQNVKNVGKEIKKKSKIIAEAMHERKVKLVGAYYEISTGKVDAVALQ